MRDRIAHPADLGQASHTLNHERQHQNEPPRLPAGHDREVGPRRVVGRQKVAAPEPVPRERLEDLMWLCARLMQGLPLVLERGETGKVPHQPEFDRPALCIAISCMVTDRGAGARLQTDELQCCLCHPGSRFVSLRIDRAWVRTRPAIGVPVAGRPLTRARGRVGDLDQGQEHKHTAQVPKEPAPAHGQSGPARDQQPAEHGGASQVDGDATAKADAATAAQARLD